MILTELYETRNGTVVFGAEDTDMEFVAVELDKFRWYIAAFQVLGDMGVDPEGIKPVGLDKV